MAPKQPFWQSLRGKMAGPQVDESDLRRRLEEAKRSLPTPVFWLLGKAQSGKTSVVRALTGSTLAEIGNGFRPCTRSARQYAFPSEDDCFLRFLDTRGLGEVDYDPTDDMEQFGRQAHLLMVVIKAMDHAQQCVLAPLREILRRHPRWPIIVVQTTLHEGYPTPDTPHVTPYPFDRLPYPDAVPRDLARSLTVEREWFADWEARFVPVDFTLPDDGFDPPDYGLPALWSAIEEALPLGLWAMLRDQPEMRRAVRDRRRRAAMPQVTLHAVAAGGAAAVPVPLVNLPLVLGIQARLFRTIASIYGQPINRQRIAEISGALGIGFLGRQGARELAKLIPVPGLGSGVAGLYAAASTFALGSALCEYFSRVLDGDVPDRDTIRALYAEEFEKGRRWLGEHLRRGATAQEPDPCDS